MTPVRRGQWSPRSRRSAAIRPARRRLAAPGTLREFDQAIDDGGRPGASSEGKRAPSGRRALVGLESEPMDALGRAGRIERLTIQPPGKPMNAIAEAIADRQSEIERLQAEIKTLNDVGQMLGTSAPAKPAARRSSSRRPASGDYPGPGDRGRRQADEEAPSDDGQREGGGVRADESLLGRAQKERREVARRLVATGTLPPPASSGSPIRPHGRAGGVPDGRSGSQQIVAYPTQRGHRFRVVLEWASARASPEVRRFRAADAGRRTANRGRELDGSNRSTDRVHTGRQRGPWQVEEGRAKPAHPVACATDRPAPGIDSRRGLPPLGG